MLGGSPVVNPTTRTHLARGLAHRGLDDSLFHADYFHLVEYFRLNDTRLHCIGFVHYIDFICRVTYFHVDSVAPREKAKCSSSES
jgi:hypothetical protein